MWIKTSLFLFNYSNYEIKSLIDIFRKLNLWDDFYDMENTLFRIYVDTRLFKGYISSSYAKIKTTPKKYEKFKKKYYGSVYHFIFLFLSFTNKSIV